MIIAAVDAALVRLLQDCGLPSAVSVESGPFEWSGAYVTALLDAAPAVRVCFMEADEYDDTRTATNLDMAGRWAVLVVTGWRGGDEASRRLGTDAGYDLLARVTAAIHGASLKDENGQPLESDYGDRVPNPGVMRMDVLTDAALEQTGLWVGAVTVAQPLPLNLPPDCQGPLDAFLRIRGDMTQPAPAAPVPLHVDLPQ